MDYTKLLPELELLIKQQSQSLETLKSIYMQASVYASLGEDEREEEMELFNELVEMAKSQRAA